MGKVYDICFFQKDAGLQKYKLPLLKAQEHKRTKNVSLNKFKASVVFSDILVFCRFGLRTYVK